MKRPPVIVIQLIHISGPLKGEIQEFSESAISIGRHPSSHVRFPADVTSVSRKHAEIVRDGNQFKLVDHSTNGTFVNGKRVKEVLLKNGDVLELSERGPKVSFLTQMKEGLEEMQAPPAPRLKEEAAKLAPQRPRKEPPPYGNRKGQEPPIAYREVIRPKVIVQEATHTEAVAQPSVEREEKIAPQHVAISLVIQFGPTLRSFKALPVTLGKSTKCNFVVDHPAIFDQHAQIFFSQDQYWIMDLTGQRSIHLNGQPIVLKASLKANDELALSLRGPYFRYLGEGRLVEIEEPLTKEPAPSLEKAREGPREETAKTKESKKASSVLKKFFRK